MKTNIGHNNPPLDPKETIQNNINRKKPILDRDPQYFDKIPLPSWIELSLIDVCNRACTFCPKSDETIAPNTYQKMTLGLIDKLAEEIFSLPVSLASISSMSGATAPFENPQLATPMGLIRYAQMIEANKTEKTNPFKLFRKKLGGLFGGSSLIENNN